MIAGNPSDETFTEKLFKEADSIPNIKLDARFIPDEELPLLIHNCDVVVIPLSLKSSLNSGSVILSFSYGRTVISPKVGTILEYPEDLVFSYLYRDEQEHVINLAKVIEKVSNIGFSDKEALLNMGEEMFHIVSKVNNKDIVVEAFLNTYKPIL
jgi:glycosyltransferase involved in cell wall biosynthesis